MKIVLDTSVLVMCLGHYSEHRQIFDALIDNKYQLAVTTEILLEYTEILERKLPLKLADNIMKAILRSPSLERINTSFRWNLIHKDPDDNKFVDCAISAGVKYVVSDDKHFRILKEIAFPYVEVITADEFLEELKQL